MERDDYLAGGGDPYVEEHPEDWPPQENTAPREVGLLDVLLPSRRRALRRTLAAEYTARVAAEHELARTQAALRQAREELGRARSQITGMMRDLDDAQQAEERLTEELFDTCDELAALRERLREQERVEAVS